MPTDTPTVEQMLRKIAEWMGLKSTGEWDDSKGLVVAGSWFGPHGDRYDSAADRERVFRAMGEDCDWTFCDDYVRLTASGFAVTIDITPDTPFELACVAAVYQWIVAQEKNGAT